MGKFSFSVCILSLFENSIKFDVVVLNNIEVFIDFIFIDSLVSVCSSGIVVFYNFYNLVVESYLVFCVS